jgi:hypothetical protein
MQGQPDERQHSRPALVGSQLNTPTTGGLTLTLIFSGNKKAHLTSFLPKFSPTASIGLISIKFETAINNNHCIICGETLNIAKILRSPVQNRRSSGKNTLRKESRTPSWLVPFVLPPDESLLPPYQSIHHQGKPSRAREQAKQQEKENQHSCNRLRPVRK